MQITGVDGFMLRKALVLMLVPLAPLAPMAVHAEVVTVRAAVVSDFTRALRIDEMLEVIRAEGLANGDDLAAEMFAGAAGADWSAAVAQVYDAGRMRQRFDQSMADLPDQDAAALADSLVFYTSDLGQKIIGLELEARRAMLDPAVEEAAQARWREMGQGAGDQGRLDLLDRFVTVNDLIEMNVAGALNANLAYYRALSGAGAFGDAMPEAQMLSEVWAQEADLRKETVDWLFPYLNLAYGSLTPDEMQAYIAFSDTAAGRKANAVIFAAFDAVFVAASTELGRAVGLRLNGQDI
jgi:hypothetical protein